MEGFARYDAYKDSGIPWIKEIPSKWEVERAKWLFNKVERPVRSVDDVVTAFRDGQVTLRSNRRTEGFTNAIQEHGYQGIRKGDLIIHAMDAFAGAIGVSDSDGKATPVYSVCVPHGKYAISSYYYAYLLRYMSKAGYIEALAKGIRERSTDFRYTDFAKLSLPLPTIDEQTRIAGFLDQKTAEIDEAIAKKQRLIELLKEQKTILINRAVTKGLNPDVPMRDSGVEWLGELPAHWEIKRLKYFSKIQSGFTLGRLYTGNNLAVVPYLRVANVQDGYFNLDEIAELNLPLRITEQYLVQIGDILVTEGGDIDKLGRGTVWEGAIDNCIHQNHIFALRINRNVASEYYVSLTMGSDYGRKYFTHTANKTTNLASTNRTKLGNFPVALPPLKEQCQLIPHVNNINMGYGDAISKAEKEILRLNEFHSTLIAHAVTGKIKI